MTSLCDHRWRSSAKWKAKCRDYGGRQVQKCYEVAPDLDRMFLELGGREMRFDFNANVRAHISSFTPFVFEFREGNRLLAASRDLNAIRAAASLHGVTT